VKRSRFIFLAGVLWAGLAQAQVSFRAELDRAKLYVGEKAILTVQAEGTGLDPAQCKLPDLSPYFQVAGQSMPQSSSRIEIVNGRMKRSDSWMRVFHLQAVAPGRFQIPPLTIYSGSNLFKTDPIAVEILAAPPASARADKEGWAPPTDPYLEAAADQDEVFVGQQVVAAWTIYYRRDLYNLNWGAPPSYRGFAAENLDLARQLDPHMENFGGALYHVAFLKSTAFFPLQSGEMSIPPLDLQFEVPGRQRDFFGQILTEARSLSSRPLGLKVKPLPEEGKPPSFGGAVGKFTISARLDKAELPAHDSVRLIVSVSGDGYSEFVGEPKLSLPPSFEVYPPEVNRNLGKAAGRFQTRKDFSYLMVPREAGTFTIPPARFDYFDPDTKSYNAIETPSLSLVVTPGRPAPAEAAQPGLQGDLTREEVKLISEDIRYLKPDQPKLPNHGTPLYRSKGFLALQLLPLLAPLLALMIRRRQERLASDVGYARTRRAFRQSRRRLKQAQALQKSGDAAAFYSELSRALTQYFADRFNLAAAGLTSDRIEKVFAEQGIEEGIRKRFLEVLALCDRARFGAAATAASARAEALRQAEELIAALERSRS